jgi:tetraacyldisaccharide 4'-kinase
MRTPNFWRSINLLSLLLFPVSLVYLLVSKLRFAIQSPVKFNKKVICIGNITAGGSGKTPIAIALGKLLIKKGNKIAYVCKNFAGTLRQPVEVNKQHTIKEVLDEALLLSKIAPTFAAKTRSEAIAQASKADFDFIIADDGLQNNSFFKDLSILVIDTQIGFGNNCILPAGPLRETLNSGLKKADLVFIVGHISQNIKKHLKDKKVFTLKAEFKLPNKKAKRYIAFAGLAYPEKFFVALNKIGANIIEKIDYADHHKYTKKELLYLLKKADNLNAQLITTEKDLVRIPNNYRKNIDCLKMTMRFQDESQITKIIESL